MTSKQIFCPIHGFIPISEIAKSIIDTPEFKRLHLLRQVGAAYLIYPSANHTRFEHSIGVYHLAGVMLKNIQKNQPELELNDRTIETVKIAGLVHDIGHGPFSHLYDDIVVHTYKRKCHEERGIEIFKHLVVKHKIKLTSQEVQNICEMINPSEDNKNNFLYQIVANKICSVDVDKIDYIQRDSYHLGINQILNFERLLSMAKVVEFNGHKQIAWPEKLQQDILMLFENRYRLHKQVYNHHAVKSAEFIIKHILEYILDKSNDPSILDMSHDAIIFSMVDPTIQQMIENLHSRKFAKHIGEKVLHYSVSPDNVSKITQFQTILDKIIVKLNGVSIKNTGWKRYVIGFISGNGENPLKNVIYFNDDNETGFNISQYNSFMEPKNYKEYIYRIYVYEKKDLAYSRHVWKKTMEKYKM